MQRKGYQAAALDVGTIFVYVADVALVFTYIVFKAIFACTVCSDWTKLIVQKSNDSVVDDAPPNSFYVLFESVTQSS